MDSIVRAIAVYLFLMVVFRIAGRRTLGDLTAFDLVLVLIVSEAIQQALLDNDNSMTNGFLVVLTLVGLNVLLSLIKQRSHTVEKLLDGVPTILVDEGQPLTDRMNRARVDIEDVMQAARQLQGLERLDQIRYAVLERTGGITIIPKQPA
ncbi:MAG: DUF421 domain-containing protein [Dehalococcoidia bacterium]